MPLAAHGACHLDEVVVHPLALQQRGYLVRGRPFPQGGEIQIKVGDALAEQEMVPLLRQAQLVDADPLPSLGDLLRGGPLDRTLVRPEAPQVDQGTHGDVQFAPGEASRIHALPHYPGHAGRYGHGGLACVPVEAGDEGVRIIGGDLLVESRQQGIDLPLQRNLAAGERIAQGHRVVGAHGATLNAGLGRGWLTGGQQHQTEQQAEGGQGEGLHLAFSRKSSTGEQLSQGDLG
ncbi:hypothetical protein D3C78_811710 [compost metagenome]